MTETSLDVVLTEINYIKKDIGEIKDSVADLKDSFITRAEFEPIKNVVYGMVGLVLISFLGAIIALVIKK